MRFFVEAKRPLIIASALAIAAVSAAQAQDAGKPAGPSGTLTIAAPIGAAATMDPQMHRSRFTQVLQHTMRDKLYYQPAPGLALAPLLAESLTAIDDTHYEAKLRQGVLLHNGDELTADDVVFTFERLWDPANKSPRASMGNMPNIEKIEAVDRYTVRWTTKVPFGTPDQAAVALGLNSQEIMPRSVYANMSLEDAAKGNVVGAGPFKLKEWVPDQHIIMDAHLDYWQGPPAVEEIIWRSVPEESTRVGELLAGSVDMIYPVTSDFVGQLKSAGMKLEIVPGTSSRMLQMSVREDSPFADVEVRKAMNMAIDKEAITEFIYQGLAIPFEQVPGIGQEGFIEGFDPFPYDPEAARKTLSGVTQPIVLYTLERDTITAEAIAEQLRGYGMNVSAQVADSATMGQLAETGKFDLILSNAGYASGDFVGTFYSNNFDCRRLESNQIATGFCEPSLDEKVDLALAEADPAARATAMQEITRLLSEEYVPWVPLFGPSEVWAMQPYVNGFVGSSTAQMFDLWKVSVDKP